MSDAFLDVTLNADGPPRDDVDSINRRIGQIRQYVKTGVVTTDDPDPQFVPTTEELDQVMRNMEYARKYESMQRDFGQRKAVASTALRGHKAASFEYSFLAQRLLDIDDAMAALGKTRRDGRPLSARVFAPLPFEAAPQRVDTKPPETLFSQPKPALRTEEELP